jgi:hypothetical protein
MSESRGNFYDAAPPLVLRDEIEKHAEELSLLGYSVMPDVLPVGRQQATPAGIRQANNLLLERVVTAK